MTTYELRPMSVGEILDRAIALFRVHFRVLIGIAIVAQGIPTLLTIYIEFAGGALFNAWLWFVYFSLSLVGGLIAVAATLRAISQAYLGLEPSLEDSLSYALGRMWALFVSGFAKYLAVGIGFIFLLIPGFIILCGLALVPQVIVVERPAASLDSLGRSWQLTKGHKWRVFFLGFVVYVIVYLPTMAAGGLAGVAPSLSTALTVLGNVLYLVLYPVVAAVFTLLYYDLRLRKEAFDLEYLSQQMGMAS